MRITYGKLKCVVSELLEAKDPHKDILLDDENVVGYASPEHINDMESTLMGLMRLKRQHRYGSATRVKFADAYNELKKQLNRAQVHASSQPIEELASDNDGVPDEDILMDDLDGVNVRDRR